MKKRVEQSAESEAFRRLLSSKVDPSPRFTKEERTIIAQYQNSLMDALLEEDRSALMRDMEKPLALLRSGASDDALQHALKDIRPGTGLRLGNRPVFVQRGWCTLARSWTSAMGISPSRHISPAFLWSKRQAV